MPAGDLFGDMMNAPKKYVVSRTLEKPIWRNTTIIRDDVVERGARAQGEPGKTILTDGSSQLVHTLFEHDLVDELHLLRLSADARPRQAASGRTMRTPGSR